MPIISMRCNAIIPKFVIYTDKKLKIRELFHYLNFVSMINLVSKKFRGTKFCVGHFQARFQKIDTWIFCMSFLQIFLST